ncbi:MAG: CHAT domain-containing protein, partial [Microscillaceae bacterium]|nr:CHAT domain-containing protein [Microscillaceae bacterium]
RPGECAIELIRSEDNVSLQYDALILRHGTAAPELLTLPKAEELETSSLQHYQTRIRLRKEDTLSYSRYWQALEPYLKGVRKVYLSADGVYHKVNLNTLLNPRTGKYLLEEIEIQLLTSTRDLVPAQVSALEKPASSAGAALLLGRPIYDLEADQHQQRAQNLRGSRGFDEEDRAFTTSEKIQHISWTDLPGTETEVRNVFAQLQKKKVPVQMYLGENAVEEVIKAVQSPRVLHLATHGFYFSNAAPAPEAKVDSSQAMAATDLEDIEVDFSRGLDMALEENAPKSASANPMLRSGLVLTGVSSYYNRKESYENSAIEDGLLTAYEAMNLNLKNTELVILSACQTAQGDVSNGEGVYGLQRGFLTAGAKSVLMSMWNVDDTATQELMTLFYENWIGKKQNKREAFLKAQRTLKAKYPEPYYWGAFVLVGE